MWEDGILLNTRKFIAILGLGVAALALPVGPIGAGAAQAQDFPAKPLEVIVPFKPGGRTDVVARLIGDKIQEKGLLSQPMAVVNADIMIRSALLQAILVSFLLFGGRFGDATLAANQVLLQFLYVTGYALDGFAFAAEALVGQAFGAGAVDRVRRGAALTTLWATITAGLLSLLFWLFGPAFIDILAKAPDVRLLAREFLPWMIAAPVMQIGLTMLDGIFIGATRSADMRNMMLLAALCYLAAVWLLTPVWANHGLWLALHVSFAARGLSLLARYPALERAAHAVSAARQAG